LSIVLVPYVGVPLYLAFGSRKLANVINRRDHLDLLASPVAPVEGAHAVDRLLRALGLPGATSGNRVAFLTNGVDGYQALCDLIENAKERIHIATYLIREDEVGVDIVRRLTEKARQGVQVRLLLDGIGCLLVKRRFLAPLVRAGGRTALFMPLWHRPFRGRTNLRNHRKIAVADGVKAIGGGTNIAAEYIGPRPKPDRWEDLAFTLEGPAVAFYEAVFRYDWHFASGEELEPPLQAPPPLTSDNGALVQVAPSGPDVEGDPLYEAIMYAIYNAHFRVWVVTPYFVPDDSLALALTLAAHRGINVRILAPQTSNHRLADLARGVNFRQVQRSGGETLYYQKGMVHAKALLVDHSLAAVGSANMDMRSLFLDHEIMMFTYSPDEIKAVEDYMLHLADGSTLKQEDAGPLRDIGEGLVRMLAPLL
jgi:cardiolipin synthase